jgi:hypothetical protein
LDRGLRLKFCFQSSSVVVIGGDDDCWYNLEQRTSGYSESIFQSRDNDLEHRSGSDFNRSASSDHCCGLSKYAYGHDHTCDRKWKQHERRR